MMRSAATRGIGFTIKQVTVHELLPDKHMALCVDTEGNTVEVFTGFNRVGIRPEEGQVWFIDRELPPRWTFLALISLNKPGSFPPGPPGSTMVMRFADADERDEWLPEPREGMLCWLEDSGRYWQYTGAAWAVLVADAATYESDYAEDLNNHDVTGTSYAEGTALQISLVCPPSRLVMISHCLTARNDTVSSQVYQSVQITQDANTILASSDDRAITLPCNAINEAESGSYTFRADFASLGGGSVAAGDTVTITVHNRVEGGTGTILDRNISAWSLARKVVDIP